MQINRFTDQIGDNFGDALLGAFDAVLSALDGHLGVLRVLAREGDGHSTILVLNLAQNDGAASHEVLVPLHRHLRRNLHDLVLKSHKNYPND